MTKFETGDRVRVIATAPYAWRGKEGTIAPTKPFGYPYAVIFSDDLTGKNPVAFWENELEHVVTITLKQAKANVKKAEADLEAAQAAVLRARTVLSRAYAKQPAEPAVGSDVRFEVQYQHHATVYTYLALRQSAGWTVTGKRNEGKVFSWAQVLEMADRGVNERKLDIRTAP